MKQQITHTLKRITDDRYIAILLGVFLVLSIIVIILLALQIHPSELQVVVHYSSFGPTNFYRDKWYYLLSFVVFLVIFAVVHTAISFRLLQKRGREFTIGFIWLSILCLVVTSTLFYQVLKIASLS